MGEFTWQSKPLPADVTQAENKTNIWKIIGEKGKFVRPSNKQQVF